jgi:hemolysin III
MRRRSAITGRWSLTAASNPISWTLPDRTVYDAERQADIRLLAVGLVAAAAAAFGMVAAALGRDEQRITAGTLCYAASLLAVLGASLLYRSATDPERRRRFRRFDHAAIFALIAGSATPFALVQSGLRGLAVTAGLWAVAAAGILFKLCYPIGSVRRSAMLYILLGWAALIALGPSLSPGAALLIAIGGVLYSGGVPFLLWRGLPYRIAIWHGFVLAGAACHYFAILEGVVLA